MKKVVSTVLTVVMLALLIPGITGCTKPSKDWYKSTLDAYRTAIQNGSSELALESGDFVFAAELLDKNNEVGYMLVDLDGDKTNELLIGFNDGSNVTKFTDVIVWKTISGPDQVLSGTNGYYTYLCASNVVCHDSWYGSNTERNFMTWDGKGCVFTYIDGEGKYLPMKWELTSF